MKFDYYTYHLAGYYLPALINGDYSGMDDQEIEQLDAWIDSLPVTGHFDIIDEEGHFYECDVSGLRANCYEVRLYFQEATQ